MNLYKILLANDVVKSINDNMDYLLELIPEIKSIMGFEHKHPDHHLDVWNHTLLALSYSKKNFDVRLSLLLHDIGKPYSYQDGEVRHFKNHPIVSSNMSRVILKRLGFSDKYVEYISYLVLNHDSPISEVQIDRDYKLCLKLYEIQRCDALAHHPDKIEKRKNYFVRTEKKLLKSR